VDLLNALMAALMIVGAIVTWRMPEAAKMAEE
jgi:hypothetical protein